LRRVLDMTPKAIAILAALAALSSVAVASTITPSILKDNGADSWEADLAGLFAEMSGAFIQHPEILNPAITAPNRERLREAVTKEVASERGQKVWRRKIAGTIGIEGAATVSD
jgi:hypothetical protein